MRARPQDRQGWLADIKFTADEELTLYLSSGISITGTLYDIHLTGVPYLPHKDTISLKIQGGMVMTIGAAAIIGVAQWEDNLAEEEPVEPPIPQAIPARPTVPARQPNVAASGKEPPVKPAAAPAVPMPPVQKPPSSQDLTTILTGRPAAGAVPPRQPAPQRPA